MHSNTPTLKQHVAVVFVCRPLLVDLHYLMYDDMHVRCCAKPKTTQLTSTTNGAEGKVCSKTFHFYGRACFEEIDRIYALRAGIFVHGGYKIDVTQPPFPPSKAKHYRCPPSPAPSISFQLEKQNASNLP